MNKFVFVFGIFDVVHQGHYRLFNFAKSLGERLVVGLIQAKKNSYSGATIEERKKALLDSGLINEVVFIDNGIEEYLKNYKPSIVVKGIELDLQMSENQTKLVENYGGRIVYWSDSVISRYEVLEKKNSKLQEYCLRNKITKKDIDEVLQKIKNLKGVIIGDSIVDEYVNCKVVGVSQEDPTIVVTPLNEKKFVGGAAIIASHAANILNSSSLFTKTGIDVAYEFMRERLTDYGVRDAIFFKEQQYKTTVKRRYITDEKTQLRVNDFDDGIIDNKHISLLMKKLDDIKNDIDFIILSDFSLGMVSSNLIQKVISFCKSNNIFVAADSQVSSKIGDITKFCGVNYVCPTEVEARVSLHDNHNNLAVIGKKLLERINTDKCVITLGKDGVFVCSSPTHDNKKELDNLPALSDKAIDVSGAGDVFLLISTCALTVGADIWMASLLGSLAAKKQVEQIGNTPISLDDLSVKIGS